MRETASLSGAILKLPTVWWISCLLLVFECAGGCSGPLTVAGSSSRSILTVFRGTQFFLIRWSESDWVDELILSFVEFRCVAAAIRKASVFFGSRRFARQPIF